MGEEKEVAEKWYVKKWLRIFLHWGKAWVRLKVFSEYQRNTNKTESMPRHFLM